MEIKQIVISIPLNLYNKTERFVENNGYINIQGLILELLRNKVLTQEDIDLDFNSNSLNNNSSLDSVDNSSDNLIDGDENLDFVSEQIKRDLENFD